MDPRLGNGARNSDPDSPPRRSRRGGFQTGPAILVALLLAVALGVGVWPAPTDLYGPVPATTSALLLILGAAIVWAMASVAWLRRPRR